MGRTPLPGSQPLAPAPPSHPQAGLGSSQHLPREGERSVCGGQAPTPPGPAPPRTPTSAAHAAHASRAPEGLIDLGKRQQNPQRLGPSRLPGAGAPVSASTISVSRLARARGRGAGWSPVRPPAAALLCRRHDLMRMSSCKLSLLRTLHPVPGSKPGVRGASPGGRAPQQ